MLTSCIFFFFNDTATTEIYTLSLHDALPISDQRQRQGMSPEPVRRVEVGREPEREAEAHPPGLTPAQGPHHGGEREHVDRKSTRLNSSHSQISYAVFCLKKKKKQKKEREPRV